MTKYAIMNFTNLNDIREYLESFKRIPHDPSKRTNANYFGRIDLNNFHLEISAGTKALCEPRVFYDDILHYKKIQVGIHETVREREDAVQPGTDDRFKGFEWLKYFTYINSKGQVKTSYMGDMIPITDFISIIRDVYKVSRLKIFF